MALASILIVEDNDFMRGLLATAMNTSGFDVVASGKTALEAVSAVDANDVEVAVLDLDLGVGPSGIDIAIALRKINPSIGIVFLTSFKDPRLSNSQSIDLPLGSRYLIKSEAGDVKLILTTVLQAKFEPLSVTKTGMTSRVPLSDRQVEILKLLSAGCTNVEIAERLETTKKAVERAIARTFNLLGLNKDPNLNPRIQLAHAFIRLTGRR